jgi:chromosome segregation ATPase
VHAPAFKWEWNVNTIAVLAGFAAGFVAWGYTLAELKTGRETNAANITEIRGDIRNLSAGYQTQQRLVENHELRIEVVERQAGEAAAAMRAVESSISSLASDMRLTREILERLERSQNGRSSN